jgi:apolipoprotein N-acyltransferase
MLTEDAANSRTGSPSGSQTAVRFISPICLENIDPAIVVQMIRDSSASGKQADFIANISNDGWFAVQERHQHLQTTVFRCIENRVPMVRCSNTGISAFIDSSGRVLESMGPDTSGFAVRQLELDGRHTFYTRHGDVFAYACLAISACAIAATTIFTIRRSSNDVNAVTSPAEVEKTT